jgi:hypothetical protein
LGAARNAKALHDGGSSSRIGCSNVDKTEAIMSTLTTTRRQFAPATRTEERPKRKPLWRRAYEALAATQQRRAEREIARYLAIHGGAFTDELERELMRRFSGGGSNRSV